MIIDIHTHISDATLAPGYCGIDLDGKRLNELMKKFGIDYAVAIPEQPKLKGDVHKMNDVVANDVRVFPNIIFCGRVNPRHEREAVDEVRRCVQELGARIIKLHPWNEGYYAFGEWVIKVVEEAARLKVPVTIHSGDPPYSLPLQIGEIAAVIPEATILMVHMGYYLYVDEAFLMAKRHPNIFLDTTGVPWPPLVKIAVERIGAERVVSGSDAPFGHPDVQRRVIELSGLSDKDKRLIMGENAARLLRLRT